MEKGREGKGKKQVTPPRTEILIYKRSTTKYEPTPPSLFHLDGPHMSERDVPPVDPFPLKRGELLGGPGFEEYSVVETGETGVEL